MFMTQTTKPLVELVKSLEKPELILAGFVALLVGMFNWSFDFLKINFVQLINKFVK